MRVAALTPEYYLLFFIQTKADMFRTFSVTHAPVDCTVDANVSIRYVNIHRFTSQHMTIAYHPPQNFFKHGPSQIVTT